MIDYLIHAALWGKDRSTYIATLKKKNVKLSKNQFPALKTEDLTFLPPSASMVRVLLPIPPIPIQQFSLNQYSVFILSYYLSVSDTEHGENHHHNSFPAWLLFSQEVIAVFLKKKFVWLSKYLSLTQPQTLHQLSKYFLKMFHTSSSNFILLETSLLEPCSQLCLVYPIPRDYFTLFRNKSFSHWPGLGRGSLLTIRSGRGDRS